MDSTSAPRSGSLADDRIDSAPQRTPSQANGATAAPMPWSGEAWDRENGRAKHGSAAEIAAFYGPIAEPMLAIEELLHRELRSRYDTLAPLLLHGTQLGGKRLRPAMVLLAGAAVGSVNQDHVVLGTVVEMVHTATLIHDDVLDGAATRRHTPTVNAKWSDDISILLGDYLFAQSFRLAATLDSTEACRWIGEAARRVCEGEMRQLLHRDVLDLDQSTYLEMIRGKTAELCQVACKLGGRHAGADRPIVEALGRYGDAIGIAFQIADDLLDLCGDDDRIGKTLGTDLHQGKITLPLIRLLRTSDRSTAHEIREVLAGPPEDRWTQIRPRLLDSDAVEYTRQVARSYRDQALDALRVLPASTARLSLEALAEFAIARRT